jgi:TldD protein
LNTALIAKADISRLLNLALSSGGDFAEVFAERSSQIRVHLEEDRVDVIPQGATAGIGIRVIAGESTGYASSDDLSRSTLDDIARTAGAIARSGKKSRAAALRQRTLPPRANIASSPASVDVGQRVSIVNRANATARSLDRRIVQVSVGYSDTVKNFCIANSDGLFVEETSTVCSLSVFALADDGRKKYSGFANRTAYAGMELFDECPPESIAREAGRMAVDMLAAVPIKPGVMPVVVGPGEGAVMFHEAVGHGLEADAVHAGASVFAGKIGTRVASPLVTLADDPTIPRRGGSIRIDDEGSPARRIALIERGILRGFMHDIVTAKHDKVNPTGNGRRWSFRHIPIPRMRNTCVMPGTTDPEEIIAATPRGLYVRKIGTGQVNTSSGDFTFAVTEGYEIENGRLARPVREASLIGRGIEVLSNIDMIGSDFAFAGGGSCGKMQPAHVDFAQPTLRIKAVTVGSA